MARAMSVAVLAVAACSMLAFVPAPRAQTAPRRVAVQAASASPESSWATPMLGLVAAALFAGAQAGYASPTPSWTSASRSDRVEFVTDPPVPPAVLEEKKMTKVKLEAAPSRAQIAEKVRRQELEYMRSTYVPGGPKPLRIVSM